MPASEQYYVGKTLLPYSIVLPCLSLSEVKDVVHPILYLLSDKADMINGATLPIDGGFLAC